MSNWINDQLGRQVQVTKTPQRIVSLVPSITQTVADLAGINKLVGVTRFCTHPDKIRDLKTVIGGTKNPNIEKIDLLSPDLIIANKEENNLHDVEQMAEKYPVFVSNIQHPYSAIDLIEKLGFLFGVEKRARNYITIIEEKMAKLKKIRLEKSPRVLYLIWRKPYMSVGKDTYIHSILELCGLKNVMEQGNRYPTLDLNTINRHEPDIVLLSSEPYPFKKQHQNELEKVIHAAGVKILLVDGQPFSWYGTGMTKYLEFLEAWIKDLSA